MDWCTMCKSQVEDCALDKSRKQRSEVFKNEATGKTAEFSGLNPEEEGATTKSSRNLYSEPFECPAKY